MIVRRAVSPLASAIGILALTLIPMVEPSSRRPPDGIFLTHAHAGHYTGLIYLGRESIDAKGVPVYGTARMASYLRANGPWSLLVSRGNIDVRPVMEDRAVDLGDGLRVTPLLVPHRDEFTDTVGYVIEGPSRSALFIPDIDQWQKWSRGIRDLADRVDVALLDGTFASADEIHRQADRRDPAPADAVHARAAQGHPRRPLVHPLESHE